MSPPAPLQPFFAQAAGDTSQSCCSVWSCCHPGHVTSSLWLWTPSPRAKSPGGNVALHLSKLRYTLKSEPWWVSGCLQGKANLREGSVTLTECPSHLNLSHVNQSPETPARALEQLRAKVGTPPCPTTMAVTCSSRTECPGENIHAVKISLRFKSTKMCLSLSSYLSSLPEKQRSPPYIQAREMLRICCRKGCKTV